MDGNYLSYILTLVIGIAGAGIGIVIGIPAGALVGSTIAVALFNVFGNMDVITFPSEIRFIFQLGLGILLGSKFTPDILYYLKEIWQPALVSAAIAIITGLLSGILISKFLGVEELTAFLATSPGGLSDMSLIALDMGAKTSVVLVIHLTRLIGVILIVPFVVRLIERWHSGSI